MAGLAVRAAWQQNQLNAVAANLQREDVVEEREHDVGGSSREGGACQLDPGNTPREIQLAILHLGEGRVEINFA
jgi:hypothetical protein